MQEVVAPTLGHGLKLCSDLSRSPVLKMKSLSWWQDKSQTLNVSTPLLDFVLCCSFSYTMLISILILCYKSDVKCCNVRSTECHHWNENSVNVISYTMLISLLDSRDETDVKRGKLDQQNTINGMRLK